MGEMYPFNKHIRILTNVFESTEMLITFTIDKLSRMKSQICLKRIHKTIGIFVSAHVKLRSLCSSDCYKF